VKVPCHRPHLRVNLVDDNMTALSQFAHKSPKLSGSHQTEPVPNVLMRGRLPTTFNWIETTALSGKSYSGSHAQTTVSTCPDGLRSPRRPLPSASVRRKSTSQSKE